MEDPVAGCAGGAMNSRVEKPLISAFCIGIRMQRLFHSITGQSSCVFGQAIEPYLLLGARNPFIILVFSMATYLISKNGINLFCA